MPPLDLLVRRAGAASSSTAPLVTATSAVSVLSFSTRAASSTSAAAPTAAPASSGGWLRALFGGGASSKKKGHRPYGQHEADHVTLATRKKDKVLEGNPGARVEPAFLPAEEAQALAAEAKEVMQKFGIAHLSEEQRQFMAGQMKHFPLPKKDLAGLINMQRVTGRFESEAQTLAPWGYGDDFNIDRVPPLLRKTLEKIQDSPHFALGKPRDITLNYRNQYFYRLDPHIDPPKDGGNVFILGLLSGTVLTLSPLSRTMAPAQFTHMNQRNVAEKSYNPGKDVDVDLPERALLHLSGPARHTWAHGIRLGVTRHQIEDFYLGSPVPPCAVGEDKEGELPLWDWWGSMKHLRPRGPERLSVIFAFADPE